MPAKPPLPQSTPGLPRPRPMVGALMGMAVGALAAGCTHTAGSPLLVTSTDTGDISYFLHSPASHATGHTILAHGFLRDPQTMHHIAESFAKNGIATACINLKRSTPWNGNHAGNARDMIALRQALGWKNVTYAGFSAGGLSALIAASEDKACTRLLLLDPVDHGALGKETAPKIRIPALALLGKPGPGNAHRNATAMLAAIPGHRTIEIPEATHCDFEARPSTLCHRLTGSKPDAKRTASVHESLIRESIGFLKQSGCNKVSHPVPSKHAAAIRSALAGRDASAVLIDCNSGETTAFPADMAEERLPPCSTYKIVNVLIGLETGILTTPDQPFYQWDGIERSIPEWNKDQTLGQAFQASCVPAFQDLARRIGAARMQDWIDRIGYGDRDISAGIDVFWLPAKDRKTLLISAREQAELMRRLVTGKLPVAEKSVAILRELMRQESDVAGSLHAKTGSGTDDDGVFNLGWFVGFAETGDDTIAFACVARGRNVMSRDARKLVESILSHPTTIP